MSTKEENAIVLFYQYVEPPWTEEEHAQKLKWLIALAREKRITGRGRVACEGVNCTLTGRTSDIKEFCKNMREEESCFLETDFKITEGLSRGQVFKALTLRKTNELVGYGLFGEVTPSLKNSKARHVDAIEFHEIMKRPDACVIDVRNAFETEIGRMVPPDDGAEFIDPKMRNSHEFPRWLALPETQKKLNAKSTILMYCTGGIRCERASALLDTLASSQEEKKTQNSSCVQCSNAMISQALTTHTSADIVMVKGGIERYLRAFPDGGFWKGANYLFDRRLEQWPKTKTENDDQPLGVCALCNTPCSQYRGRFLCTAPACADAKVPVIVCSTCRPKANPNNLCCTLCRNGYHGARNAPRPELSKKNDTKRKRASELRQDHASTQFLFIGNIPLATSQYFLLQALDCEQEKQQIQVYWLADRTTCLFYGSAVLDTGNPSVAATILRNANKPIILNGRVLRLGFYRANRPPDAFYSTAPTPPIHPLTVVGSPISDSPADSAISTKKSRRA